jgi:serine/threonine protein kinase/Tfp pilus assembly protein PilF
MTPERWRHIKELFHAALERPPGERAAFLDAACAEDEATRREVSQLLSEHEQPGEFLDTPAFELAARSLAGAEPTGLAPGQAVGRYRVVKLLGTGGMGEVYLAEDDSLGRSVALKLLPASFTAEADRVSRFEREARAASSPNHPNVCTIYEVGEAEDGRRYIVMEHVEGETLRLRMKGERMGMAEALDVSAQITSGLAAAHAVGVVHRDVKPENVMLRPDGIVKVLDFGLAKLTARQPVDDSTAPAQARVRTETGVVLGTATYMSPEQARGFEVDARTDVWSLGCVIYEMLAGGPPFTGETTSDVVAAVLKTEPAPLPQVTAGVPGELQRIVAKCLEKEREQRYPSAEELLADLRRLRRRLEVGEARAVTSHASRTLALRAALAAALILAVATVGLGLYFYKARVSPPVGDKKSIAVLPLKPISAANRDELYGVGIADSLIHRLNLMKGFVVRPLSATRKYADLTQDPLSAGREQRVDYVLDSNYQLAGGKIRITAQLFNVASGQVEGTYQSAEKDTADVFALQDAIAEEVGNLLQARFATVSSSPAAKRGTTSEEAYRLYLQAMYLIDKENSNDSKRAVELLDEALALDPNYAKAWAGKARAHCHYAHSSGTSPDVEFAKARPAIERAFALDGDLAEAHAVLGIITTDYNWDFAEGERRFLRAIELAPNSDIIHRWYANRLASQGRADEAIAVSKTAIDLNPNYVIHQIWYGYALYSARRYDDAITQLRRVAEMDSTNPIVHSLLWQSYHLKGDHPRAYESFMRFQRLIGAKDETLKSFEAAYVKSGWQAVLLENLEALKANDASGSYTYVIGHLSALAGQPDQSFLYLDEAIKNRSLRVPSILGDPALDSLRGDPRFAELVGGIASQRR